MKLPIFWSERSLCHLSSKLSITMSRFNIYYLLSFSKLTVISKLLFMLLIALYPSQGKHLHGKKTELFILLTIACDHTFMFTDIECSTFIGLGSGYITFWLKVSNSHMNVFKLHYILRYNIPVNLHCQKVLNVLIISINYRLHCWSHFHSMLCWKKWNHMKRHWCELHPQDF